MTRILCNHCSHFFGSWKEILIRGMVKSFCPACGMMKKTNRDEKHEVISPVEIIKGLMVQANMEIEELSCRMRVKVESAIKLLKGQIIISFDVAMRLEKVFKISRSFWMNAENNYRMYLKLNGG